MNKTNNQQGTKPTGATVAERIKKIEKEISSLEDTIFYATREIKELKEQIFEIKEQM